MIRFIQQRAERFLTLFLPRRKARSVLPRAKKSPSVWRWNGLEVVAFAKTDARGKLKRLAGLKRLPVGAVVERIAVA